MPTYAADLLPDTNGRNLGNANQKWDATLRNATIDSVLSSGVNSAAAGDIRLPSTGEIAWRSDDNTKDLDLSKSGPATGTLDADLLEYSGPGIEADSFVSGTANPSSSGTVRLAATDAIEFRNQAGNNNIFGMFKDTDDTIVVGGTNGVKSSVFSSSDTPIATGGTIRLANTGSVAWRNAANSGDYFLAPDVSDRLSTNATNGFLVIGTSAAIRIGGATSASPMLKRVAAALQCRLSDDSDYASFSCEDLTVAGRITGAGGVSATTGPGVPVLVERRDLTAQSTAITTVSWYTPGVSGMWRLGYYLFVTTAGNTVNLTGTFGWNDGAAAQSLTTGNIACQTLGANSTSALGLGNIDFYSVSGQAITYATALSGAIGAGRYAVYLRLLYLG